MYRYALVDMENIIRKSLSDTNRYRRRFYLHLIIFCIFVPVLSVILVIMFFVLWGHKNLTILSFRLIAWSFLKIFGLKVIFENRFYAQQHRPCIFVGNHQDFTDAILGGYIASRNTMGIWKKELADIFLFRLFLHSSGSILMDADDPRYSVEQLKLAEEKILVHKQNFLIFPEGHIGSPGERMGPFGVAPFHLAAKTAAPIVPFIVSDLSKIIDIKKCILIGGTIRIRYLPPVHVKDQSSNELRIKVRKIMEEAIERLWQE